MRKIFSTEKMTIEERLDFIEFRQKLLFNNTEVDRMIFEYNITREQYTKIIDLMEKYRFKISNKEEVNNSLFEDEIYNIVEHLDGNYHFCEYMSKGFMNEGKWEEVFIVLYGDMLNINKL